MNPNTILETEVPDKHKTSILSGSDKIRVKRPGSKRQIKLALFILAIIPVIILAAFLILKPKQEVYNLKTFESAKAEIKTITDIQELSGTISIRQDESIITPNAGVLAELPVETGDWIDEGTVVAVLESEELEENLTNLEQELVQGNRNYQRFQLNYQLSVLTSEQNLRTLEETYNQKQEFLAEQEELFRLKTVTLAELEAAQEDVENAAEALDDFGTMQEIEKKLHLLDEADQLDILVSIQDSIQELQQQIDDNHIESPLSGRIISMADRDEVLGSELPANFELLRIADTTRAVIQTTIEEQYVASLKVGQTVGISLSGILYPGEIEEIGLLAQTPASGGTPEVDLKIALHGEDEQLPGASAIVQVIVGQVEDAVVLPRGPYITSGNRKYLYVVEDGQAVRREVTYGVTTESEVEIVSGLEAGETVILSSYQNYIDFESVNITNPQEEE